MKQLIALASAATLLFGIAGATLAQSAGQKAPIQIAFQDKMGKSDKMSKTGKTTKATKTGKTAKAGKTTKATKTGKTTKATKMGKMDTKKGKM